MKYVLNNRILQNAFSKAATFLFKDPNYNGDIIAAFKSHFNIIYTNVPYGCEPYACATVEFESEEDMFLFLMEWS